MDGPLIAIDRQLTPNPDVQDDNFGSSVAVDGDTVIVGAFGDDEKGFIAGAAYSFTWTGTSWHQQKLTASDGGASQYFGESVAIYGKTVIIGASHDDDNGLHSGSIYVFLREDGKWIQKEKLKPSDGAAFQYFGHAVATAADTVVVGQYTDDDKGPDAGAAYVFTREASGWAQRKIFAGDAQPGDQFGSSVSISGHTIIVGSNEDDDLGVGSGAAYFFNRANGQWLQQSKIYASDGAAYDGAAHQVAVSEGIVLIGVPGRDDVATQAGAAYVFEVSRFGDVLPDFWAYSFVEGLSASGITAGCGSGNYCPKAPVTRAQMAVFLERGMRGSGFIPPPAEGNVFLDVPANAFAANFIEQLSLDGITSGCGGGNYCPTAAVTREQMAVFLLRAKYGSGYSPPPASGIFSDVPLSHWAVHWIEALAGEGITAGCGNGAFCPKSPVTRDQMAVFLVRTFGLQPKPSVNLTAAPDFALPGSNVTLVWSSRDAVSCSASGAWIGTKPASGRMEVVISDTSVYGLECRGAGGAGNAEVTVKAATPLSGVLAAGVYPLANSPYVLIGRTDIAPNTTVSFEPGVRLLGQGNELRVFGTLQMVGTPAQRILIDSVRISPHSQNSESLFRIDLGWCDFNSGSFFYPIGNAIYGSFSVTDCRLSALSWLYLWYPKMDSEFSRNVFQGCDRLEILLGSGSTEKLDLNNNVFRSCPVEIIEVYNPENLRIKRNSFLDVGVISIRLKSGSYTRRMIDATQNYWGTTNTSTISSMVFDELDDLAAPGIISFDPYLNSPDPGTLAN